MWDRKSVFVTAVATLCIILIGCPLAFKSVVTAWEEVRVEAFRSAEKYIGMDYEWGGQDHWSTRGVDCSGLVVNVYKEATQNTAYTVPFEDAAVVDFLTKYTEEITEPEIGDLIFMGTDDITHVSLYEKEENGRIYFIDAYSISGTVNRRSYEADNVKIKRFGRLLLIRK